MILKNTSNKTLIICDVELNPEVEKQFDKQLVLNTCSLFDNYVNDGILKVVKELKKEEKLKPEVEEKNISEDEKAFIGNLKDIDAKQKETKAQEKETLISTMQLMGDKLKTSSVAEVVTFLEEFIDYTPDKNLVSDILKNDFNR